MNNRECRLLSIHNSALINKKLKNKPIYLRATTSCLSLSLSLSLYFSKSPVSGSSLLSRERESGVGGGGSSARSRRGKIVGRRTRKRWWGLVRGRRSLAREALQRSGLGPSIIPIIASLPIIVSIEARSPLALNHRGVPYRILSQKHFLLSTRSRSSRVLPSSRSASRANRKH